MNVKSSVLMILLILSFTVSLLLAACNDVAYSQKNSSAQTETEDIAMHSNKTDGAEVLEEAAFFKITKKDGLFYYTIYDKNNRIVQSVGNLTKEPRIVMVEDSLVRITTQAGTGIATQAGYYYDAESNVFSQVYQSVFDQCNGIVAYATDEKVIIRDIFDNNGYYRELSDFDYVFSEVSFPFINVEFINNGSSVCVKYLSGEEFDEVSEIFELT